MTTPGRGLHGHVLDTLGPEITAGEYPPGSVLRTDELAQRFDVSRSVMREAVRVLESMHLVESRRRVGVTVRPKSEWNVYDPEVIRWRLAGADRPGQLRSLTMLRSAVEPVAAGLAARHATAEQCADLTECALGMVANSRGHKLEEYLVHDVAEVLAGRTHHDVMFEDPDPAAVTLHVQVAEAVRAGDAVRAEELTREITVGALQELDILAP
jgi:DNA-binding FadR family transcriptional regulator